MALVHGTLSPGMTKAGSWPVLHGAVRPNRRGNAGGKKADHDRSTTGISVDRFPECRLTRRRYLADRLRAAGDGTKAKFPGRNDPPRQNRADAGRPTAITCLAAHNDKRKIPRVYIDNPDRDSTGTDHPPSGHRRRHPARQTDERHAAQAAECRSRSGMQVPDHPSPMRAQICPYPLFRGVRRRCELCLA